MNPLFRGLNYIAIIATIITEVNTIFEKIKKANQCY